MPPPRLPLRTRFLCWVDSLFYDPAFWAGAVLVLVFLVAFNFAPGGIR